MKTKWIAALGILLALMFGGSAYAAEHCEDAYSIDQTMPNGSRWDMCWTHDANQGIRYHHIYYTPSGESRRMVLYDASVAQIHVPYDDNGARYHDVSDFGLGGDYLLSMSSGDCPDGNLSYYNGKGAVCQQLVKDGSAFRANDNRADQYFLKVYSVSRVGEYLYASEWRFFADGRIMPSIIATGALQRFGGLDKEQHGWLIADSGENRVGLSHMHNFFWRLDFDINGTGANDLVKEVNYSDYAGKRYRQMTTFNNEAARSVNPQSMRSWLIQDGDTTNNKGHNIGYEIRLIDAGQREVGPSFEPFTNHDFFVTKSRDCERVASHNQRVHSCDTDNLQEFVSGESIRNQDIVAWVGVSFYHMPRSEDTPYMDAHTSQYEIVPRDWHTVNPSLDYTPPIELRLSASDDYASTSESSAVLVDAMGNDTGNGISYNTLDNPGNGTATIVGDKIRYVPDAGFIGTDVFWYSIKDSSGSVFGAQIYVTVTEGSSDDGSGGVSTGGGGSVGFRMLLLLMLSAVLLPRRRFRESDS